MLVGTLDEAPGAHGLLVVTGGRETRFGPHRLFARLAAALAAQGIPVFRFDRRGTGDSDGADPGFEASGPDIAAALAAFRALCPAMTRVSGFGLCDGATALLLAGAALDGLVLANPWLAVPADDLPPPAAIRRHYRAQLFSARAWARLVTGGIDGRKAWRGLRRVAAPARASTLARRALAHPVDAVVVLADGDATAQAAAAELRRVGSGMPCVTLPTASHSFAEPAAFAALLALLRERLR